MVVRAAQCLPEPKRAIFIGLQEHYAPSKVLDAYFPNAHFTFLQGVTQGQACTCEIGIRAAGVGEDDPILISACDNAAVYDQKRFLEMIDDASIDVIVWAFTNHPTGKINPNMYSWLNVDDKGFIHGVACKQFIEDRKHAIIGTMYFRKAKYFLDGLKVNQEHGITINGEYYVDSVINRNLEQGLKIKVFEVDDYICWGTPGDYKTYLYWSDYFKK